jgi:hypothetical protein
MIEAPLLLPWSCWPQRQTGIIGGRDPEPDGGVAPMLGGGGRWTGPPLTQSRLKQYFPLRDDVGSRQMRCLQITMGPLVLFNGGDRLLQGYL